MNTPELLCYAAIVAGYLLALARLNDKARLFWQFLPVKIQPLMPALVVVLPELALGLQRGTSVEDVLGALVTAAGALMISLRGAVPAKHFEQLSADAKKEIAVVRGSAPKGDDGPPTPRTGAGAAPIAMLLLAGALSLNQTACGKQALPPGCTEADFAALAATCPDEATCNEAIDAKQTRCNSAVEAE